MSSSVSNSTPFQWWKPCVVSPLAGGISLIGIPFYCLVVKSAWQAGEKAPLPHLSMYRKSLKASRPLALQILLNNIIEEGFKRKNGEQQSSLRTMVTTSLVAGTVSAPLLAGINGYTMTPPRPFFVSVKALTFREFAAIITRENSFLLIINFNGYFAAMVQERFKGTKGVDYATAFGLGMTGSAIGHAPDAALTIWQKGRKITRVRQLSGGLIPRALGIGVFNVEYLFWKKQADKFS